MAADEWARASAVPVVPPVRPRKLAKVPRYSCRTNNNRPCGGLRGYPCKHLDSLMDEAVLQYGADRVIRYLYLDVEPAGATVDSALADLLAEFPATAEALATLVGARR